MTSTATDRAEISRPNGSKSTGPKTPEGKSRSKFNAVKHGLSAKTLVLPGEDGEAFQGRLDAWTNDLAPRHDLEQDLTARAAQFSWQLDRPARAEAAPLPSLIRASPDELALRQEDE